MADVFTASGARAPRTPLAETPTPTLSGAQIMQPYTETARAIGFLGEALDDATVSVQAAAGAKGVEMDAEGNVQVNWRWGEFSRGDKAYNAAARTSALAKQGVQISEDMQRLRQDHDGRPEEFQAAAKSYLKERMKGADPLIKPYIETEGLQVASQHLRGIISDKERLDTARFANDLEAREKQLLGRAANLAEQGGTDTPEFVSTFSELQDLRNQRAANPKFTYSPTQAAIDNESTAQDLRAVAITGIARRDYVRTGDLARAQEQAEASLKALGLSPDKVSGHLTDINRNLAGAAAARADRLNDLEERARATIMTLDMGGMVDPRQVAEIQTGLESGKRFSSARALELKVAGARGADSINSAKNTAEMIEALQRPMGTTNASPVDVARNFEGLTESGHAGVLKEFFRKTGGDAIDPRRVAWCAAFVDACLQASGNDKLGSLRAADFLKYGTATDKPTQGDVVVFKPQARGASGHVGIVIGVEGDRVRYIAGNDGNKVQENTLPASEVMGFRVPTKGGETIALPAASQRRGEVVAYGSSSLSGIAEMRARQQAFDTRAKNLFESIDEGWRAGLTPSPDEVRSLVDIAPYVAAPELRSRISSRLLEESTKARANGAPIPELEAIAAQLQTQEQAGGLEPMRRMELQAVEAALKSRREALETTPYVAAQKHDFGVEINPTVTASSMPIRWNDPSAVAASFQARAKTSSLIENVDRVPARSLIQGSEVDGFRAAVQQGGGNFLSSFYSALSETRPENIWATLDNSGVKETLLHSANTSDPVKYTAAMSGLDKLQRLDPGKFRQVFGQDAVIAQANWSTRLAYENADTLQKELTRINTLPSEARSGMIKEARDFAAKKDATEIFGTLRRGLQVGDRSPADTGSFIAMKDEYRTLVEDAYLKTGNLAAADTAAIDAIRDVWQVSGLNAGRIMKHPPEKYYPTVDGSHDWMANQLQRDLQERLGLNETVTPVDNGGEIRTAIPTVQYNLVATPETQADVSKGSKSPRYRVIYTDPATGRIKDIAYQFDINRAPEVQTRRDDFNAARTREDERRAGMAQKLKELSAPLDRLNEQRNNLE